MYDPQFSILLAKMSELTYVQYNNGPPPSNNGTVTMPRGYTQIASFHAPEINLAKNKAKLLALDWKNMKDCSEITNLGIGEGEVYFGFAATSATHNVIALRGTQSIFEWAMNLNVEQVDVPLFWFNHDKFKVAKAHLGFLLIFAMLYDQISAAVEKFDNKKPCYICGHSLGAALATLAAPSLQLIYSMNVKMYNYASPRVGDPVFAEAFNALIDESYRVVNLSDLVPIIPPTTIEGWNYQQVKGEWSFLNQTGNVTTNHALIGPNNYTDAVNNQIPTDATRTYPVTGL